MIRLEVRCCCDPGKLLGWLDVPPDKATPGARLHYRTIRPIVFGEGLSFDEDRVELEVGLVENVEYCVEPGVPESIVDRGVTLAVKSNDVPLARLKRIPSFRAAGEAES